MEKALFGAGCFWCVEDKFNHTEGVQEALSGYSGGEVDNPSYEQVCTGRTGHAEVVEVTFDPAKVSYDQLLDIYFGLHDPTQLNRQGPDVGTQYRSVIFYHSEAQQAAAQAKIDALAASGRYPQPIVTQVLPAKPFFAAEDYHQRYYEKHRRGGVWKLFS